MRGRKDIDGWQTGQKRKDRQKKWRRDRTEREWGNKKKEEEQRKLGKGEKDKIRRTGI